MNLLLGVTGGIAAYKACEICSLARKNDHNVRVILSENAKRFISPLIFEGLTGEAVMDCTFSDAMDHINWAKWCDVACVAPLTANTMAKFAVGMADDPLCTTFLAIPADKAIVLCPAMNTEMWNHPATQRNLQWLEDLNRFSIVPPIDKRLACGDIGIGALADPQDILQQCEKLAGIG